MSNTRNSKEDVEDAKGWTSWGVQDECRLEENVVINKKHINKSNFRLTPDNSSNIFEAIHKWVN